MPCDLVQAVGELPPLGLLVVRRVVVEAPVHHADTTATEGEDPDPLPIAVRDPEVERRVGSIADEVIAASVALRPVEAVPEDRDSRIAALVPRYFGEVLEVPDCALMVPT